MVESTEGGAAVAPAPDTDTWTVRSISEVKEAGSFLFCDRPVPADRPGVFVVLRAHGTDDAFESLTSVSAPGEDACLYVSQSRRMQLKKRLAPGLKLEVRQTIYGKSETLANPKERTPVVVLNAGVSPLALSPLASVLQWRAPAGSAPRVYWAVHAAEELQYVARILETLAEHRGGAKAKAAAGAVPRLTVVLCGRHGLFEDHEAAAEAVRDKSGLYPDGRGFTLVREAEGLDTLPAMVAKEVAEEGLTRVALELFSHKEARTQFRHRLEHELSQRGLAAPVDVTMPRVSSFGYCTPNMNSWAMYEPWPLTSWLPPFSILPCTFGRTALPFHDWLFIGTDPMPLALFRIAFGYLIMRYGQEAITSGRAHRDHEWSGLRFKYDFYEWLGPDMGPPHCYWIYYAMGAAGFGIMIGWPYRLSSAVFTATFVWHFFVEASHYNNHYYLMFVLGFLFTYSSADACLKFSPVEFGKWLWACAFGAKTPPAAVAASASSGGEKKKVEAAAPSFPEEGTALVDPIPNLHHFLFRGLVLFVFFYGFVAKLNNEWISGHVMRAGMEGMEDPPWLLQEICVFFLAWGGLVFDGVGPLYLCYNPLRIPALIIFAFFNVANMLMFQIGCFPWMMLGSMVLLCETHTMRDRIRQGLWWCSQVKADTLTWGRLPAVEKRARAFTRYLGFRLFPKVPAYKDAVHQLFKHETYYSMPNGVLRPPAPRPMPSYPKPYRMLTTLVLFLILMLEFTFPLRNWVYHHGTDQQVAWTEHGRKFSWHMMSRHKACEGNLTVVHDQLGYNMNISLLPETYNGPIRVNQHQLKKVCTVHHADCTFTLTHIIHIHRSEPSQRTPASFPSRRATTTRIGQAACTGPTQSTPPTTSRTSKTRGRCFASTPTCGARPTAARCSPSSTNALTSPATRCRTRVGRGRRTSWSRCVVVVGVVVLYFFCLFAPSQKKTKHN